ncbi:MAG: DUF4235 domain-containing protein [Solirubrobacterales bacterium]|nr:DUF4235 domain-containing protein [Solirubrobacterales bacterium]MCB8971830.1 DUF4235 domain-containing protein [Thermoleophilales bacterium]MCO5326365.1 DUF4235 domain-containing protein [Solirubrobacterales bacterium]
MKFIYKPFAIIVGLLAGILSKKVFEKVWGAIADDDPRDPDDRDASWAEVIASAAVAGAVVKVVQALVRRGGAKSFERATGYWPGDDPAG